MAQSNVFGQIDEAIGSFFAQWNITSTIIAGLLAFVLIYPLFASKDPDTHPFLLARQAQASPIRQEGESATYRSTEIPYGYPLRSGLGIKDPGASKWTTGRDGDLRDIWRQTVTGPKKEDGSSTGPTAKVITVHGVEQVVEHDLSGLTLDINVVGKHLGDAGSRKVAVCLSNSVELMCTIFAGAFYSFSPILVPYSQEPDTTSNILAVAEFDTLVAEAGTISLDRVLQRNKSLKRIIWVAKAGNKHLDWNEVPEGIGGKLDVVTWQDLVEEKKAGSSNEVPPLEKDEALPVYAFWPTKSGNYELIEYTQKVRTDLTLANVYTDRLQNLIAGVAAVQSSMPRLQKLQPTDSVLPTSGLNTSYALCWALLTLFSGSTLILNSVSGPEVDLIAVTKSARQAIKPTYIIADARAVSRFLNEMTTMAGNSGIGGKYGAWSTARTISQGYMDVTQSPSYLPVGLSGLKTFYIAQPDVVERARHVKSSSLASLRLLLGARVALALTTGRVAGYVAQTNVFDYRDKGDICCVGPVAASLELHLAGDEQEMSKADGVGILTVKGPAVTGKGKDKAVLDHIRAKVDSDNTLVLM
ncbi:hypothetical protein PMZ80_010521 [Knufia obscura]|uniref:AMP-dependent synthetase/ligase domain-containing protein n=1 Tax=Knufia obscura TaxID=1635080 RepID=A0ABR0R9I6_9EURO|nr:hypothetical protein PMZ80_010521 [Knufia obscura]